MQTRSFTRILLRQWIATTRVLVWRRSHCPPSIDVSVSTDLESGMIVLVFATSSSTIAVDITPTDSFRSIWAIDIDAIAAELVAEMVFSQGLDKRCDEFLNSLERMAPLWAAAKQATSEAINQVP